MELKRKLKKVRKVRIIIFFNFITFLNFTTNMYYRSQTMPISPKTIDEVLRSAVGQRAYRIVETLSEKGFDTWWVGGAVRDMLAGRVPKDIDIATKAKPDQIHASFARASGGEESFGSARVMLGETEFEVTTYREDDEASDGRHPEGIVFGTRQQDAKRRDFTVNAM